MFTIVKEGQITQDIEIICNYFSLAPENTPEDGVFLELVFITIWSFGVCLKLHPRDKA
jgi:hypothetical protein